MANLKSMCEQCLSTKLSPESAIDTFILAETHNATQLKSAAIQYIAW